MLKLRWLALLAAGMALCAVTASAQANQSIIGCLLDKSCEERQQQPKVVVGLFGPVERSTGPPGEVKPVCLFEDCGGLKKQPGEVVGSLFLFSEAPKEPRVEVRCNIIVPCEVVKHSPVTPSVLAPSSPALPPLGFIIGAQHWALEQAKVKAAEAQSAAGNQSRLSLSPPVSRERASQQAAQSPRVTEGPPVSRARAAQEASQAAGNRSMPVRK
jgi:hypothetical protein